ncbi:MAG: hypothetical protein Q8P72_03510 [Candidatus Roizmanbacteria bacterium]|nr:hypothetical protein [Candidatus Roizmanbacteria bacterium]
MKSIKIIILSFVFALIVYGVYAWIQSRNVSLSPIPEDGVKVIQVSPN